MTKLKRALEWLGLVLVLLMYLTFIVITFEVGAYLGN